MPEEEIQQAGKKLKVAVTQKQPVVVMTGAGISAESGIPTFRGAGGLWQGFRAEELATPQAFAANPQRVWEWYQWRRDLVGQAQPNDGHLALVALEEKIGEAFTLITQNVDGLHRRAGSQRVIEIHGTLLDSRCSQCDHQEPLPPQAEGLIHCSACGGLARPAVVWFGESLPSGALQAAYESSQSAAVVLVVGTSAVVQPAAGLIAVAAQAGATVIEVNPDPSGMAQYAHHALRDKAGTALPQLVNLAGINFPAGGEKGSEGDV